MSYLETEYKNLITLCFNLVKPLINREKLQKIIVRVGQTVKFDVDVRGEPPPTTIWSLGNKPLITGRSVKIEDEDYNTKLTLSETTRKNTGVYSLRAENASGFDEATVEVVILGNVAIYIPITIYNFYLHYYVCIYFCQDIFKTIIFIFP